MYIKDLKQHYTGLSAADAKLLKETLLRYNMCVTTGSAAGLIKQAESVITDGVAPNIHLFKLFLAVVTDPNNFDADGSTMPRKVLQAGTSKMKPKYRQYARNSKIRN